MGSVAVDGRIKWILEQHRPALQAYEKLYRHFHQNPELSKLEKNTAAKIAQHLREWDFVIHENIGGHGLVAVLENGNGKKVLLRADMDALPVQEKTGLAYASTKRMVDCEGNEHPVMHACGHDVHITTLLAAAETLCRSRAEWSGTLICLFQPAEEKCSGALDMISDGVYDRIGHTPDIVLGAHVSPYPSGFVGIRPGVITSNADGFKITIFGRGGHASMPDATIDPVVMASHIVVRLQTIVAREVSPLDMAVLTVGSIQSGETENIISDQAIIRVNIRTHKKEVRDKVLASLRRIVDAECLASNAPKPAVIEPTISAPMTLNDVDSTALLSETFGTHFGPMFKDDIDPIAGSEDFSILATEIGKPCCFWLYGSTNPAKFQTAMAAGTAGKEIPVNHSPFFAPEIETTLSAAIDSYVVAALTWL